ncbi:aminoacyl-tRNA hydrolase [bacterium M21]|nr:aminoacyl-tRNA hydrolase [bacterium M21]
MTRYQEALPRLIVGLGNPGDQYVGTRHNIGFMVIDHLLSEMVQRIGEPRHFAESYIWDMRYAGRKVFLQKPVTFMNLSGKAVAKFCREQQLLPEEILVLSDDLDLPLGTLRMRKKGGGGGHNGLGNIIDQLGTQKFNRLRIGIGRDSETNSEIVDYVLGSFDSTEQEKLPAVIKGSADAVQVALRRGVSIAMNQCNGSPIFLNENHIEKTEESQP